VPLVIELKRDEFGDKRDYKEKESSDL